MLKKLNIWRGVAIVASFLLTIVIVLALIVERYRTSADALFGTVSQDFITEEVDGEEIWNYDQQFKTAKEAVEGYKRFALKEGDETVALLKNKNNALPIAKTSKITLLGMRSYAPVYGGSMASIPDPESLKGNEIFDAFKDEGFGVNPSQLAAYKAYLASIGETEWATHRMTGGKIPEYSKITITDDVVEPSPAELKTVKADYDSEYAAYGDAAIVVFGRPSGEGKTYSVTLKEGVTTETGHILSLTNKEQAILDHAKANFDKVIVLLNAANQLDVKSLEEDDDVDAIVWIGEPGSYGFHGVARVLNGTVNPSAHLGDTYATNSTLAPAMQNFGEIKWGNADDGTFATNHINSYLVNSEGIYTGYRYYETRYEDTVMGVESAKTASAGTYADASGKAATTAGTWSYANEVVYPFGYGLSYTTFKQELKSVTVDNTKKTATVSVTVTNTGNVAGKSVVQLYVQTPYTDYDKTNKVEKSAIQLVNYEKTGLLAPGAPQTITMTVDMANVASYDYTKAKTYIADYGDYYFAIGDDAHDALNNVLAAKGKTVADGMTAAGDATKTYKYTWTGSGEVDNTTFSVSDNGTTITNHLSEGTFAMDINAFIPNTVTYLTRSDWNGTFPKTISGLTATAQMMSLLKNQNYTVKTNEDTSSVTFGKKGNLKLADLKGADFEDERWQQLLDQLTIADFLYYAEMSFHGVRNMDTVGLLQYAADDGPGGADSSYFGTGSYHGKTFEDAADYANYGTRVAPAPINLSYSFNKELAFENGLIILGESALMFKYPLLIGPGLNIHRHAWNGRGFEYYSEDPILSGYTASAVTQGAQYKGCMVNLKHPAFNDQEKNRAGVAVFTNEQAARELELRNLQQALQGKGKPSTINDRANYDDAYKIGALGIMSSYNRIGCVASSANYGVMYNIFREEFGFHGYNVTDMLGTVTNVGMPIDSIIAGTTNFCAFSADPSIASVWNEDALKNDLTVCNAIRRNAHYALYALANSAAMYGINSSSHMAWLMTWWRALYIALIVVFSVVALAAVAMYVTGVILKSKEAK